MVTPGGKVCAPLWVATTTLPGAVCKLAVKPTISVHVELLRTLAS
jgi:hypothetical protein